MRTRSKLVAGLAAMILVALPVKAAAHVEMKPPAAPAGEPVRLGLEVGHGCDGAPTTRLVVQVPERAAEATALPVDGWRPQSAPGLMTWTGGPLDDHDTLTFPFRTVLSGERGQQVTFKVIQQCAGGASSAWVQTPTGGDEPDYPAPTVRLTSTDLGAPSPEAGTGDEASGSADAAPEPATEATGTDAADDSESGSGTRSILLLVIAGLLIGTIAGLVVRRRRTGSS